MNKCTITGLILLIFPTFIFAHNILFSFDKNSTPASLNIWLDRSENTFSNSKYLLGSIPFDVATNHLIHSDTIPDESDSSENTSSNSNNKAEKLFNDLSYLTSADYFLKMEKDGKLTPQGKEKLADSYRLNGMTEEAEYWYAQIINDDPSTMAFLHYAEMLHSNGKCEDAVRWFKNYVKYSGDNDRTFIQDCNELNEIPETKGVSVKNIESLNTPNLDFSPVQYKNGIVFSSTRGLTRATKNTDKWTKDNFSDLFFAEKDEDQFSKIKPLNGINDKFHDGTATFNQAGDYMIFTRNSPKEKSKKGVRELKLYEADLEGNDWINIKSLNINNKDYPTCHPTLSQDGKRLYFSSKRPDGYGGMDIYMSQKMGNEWTDPKNLGPIVNSSGNELFPFILDDEKLYFSSNGHKGVGGLDIFVVEKSNPSDETTWSIRKNIGKPFNSRKDDIGFTVNKDNQSGYFASNRVGSMGKDDIYSWTSNEEMIVEKEKEQLEKTFCAYNIMNNQRIEGVDVSIISGDFQADYEKPNLTLIPSTYQKNEYILAVKKQNKTYTPNAITTTDENGNFDYRMEDEQDYFFILAKEGFATVQHQTDFPTVKKRDEYCFAMAPQSCVMMKGSVVNKNYNRQIPLTEIEIFNRCTGEINTTLTDENGEFEMCVSCDCEFEILAKKDRFKDGVITFSTMESNCDEKQLKPVSIELILLDRMEWSNSDLENKYNTTSQGKHATQQHPFNNSHIIGQAYGSSPHGNNALVTKEFLLEYFTGNKNSVIETGQTFTLKNIYYDFNRSNIRADARLELDYIANLMMIQPTIEISLISHTDAIGDDDYNQLLSRKRAESAKEYLITKGISQYRIHEVKGMGEQQPIVPCFDRNCSDSDHQTNRRTEIIIKKI